MVWLLYSSISVFLTIIYSILSKKIISDKKTVLNTTTFSGLGFFLVGFIFFLLYLLLFPNTKDFTTITNAQICKLLLANIIVYTIAPYFYYKALKHLPLSVVTIIYSLSGFMAFFIESIFKINPFHFSGMLGSILVVTSVILISLKIKDLKKSPNLPHIFLATLLYSVAGIFDKKLSANFTEMFYISLTFFFPGLLLLLSQLNQIEKVKRFIRSSQFPPMLVYCFFIGINFYFIFKAYAVGGSTSQVYSVLSLESVLTVIASAIFLKEWDNLTIKFLSAIIAGLGIYLLSLA